MPARIRRVRRASNWSWSWSTRDACPRSWARAGRSSPDATLDIVSRRRARSTPAPPGRHRAPRHKAGQYSWSPPAATRRSQPSASQRWWRRPRRRTDRGTGMVIGHGDVSGRPPEQARWPRGPRTSESTPSACRVRVPGRAPTSQRASRWRFARRAQPSRCACRPAVRSQVSRPRLPHAAKTPSRAAGQRAGGGRPAPNAARAHWPWARPRSPVYRLRNRVTDDRGHRRVAPPAATGRPRPLGLRGIRGRYGTRRASRRRS